MLYDLSMLDYEGDEEARYESLTVDEFKAEMESEARMHTDVENHLALLNWMHDCARTWDDGQPKFKSINVRGLDVGYSLTPVQ